MEIEKNVPMPSKITNKDIFGKMEIGDSIVYSGQYEASRIAMKRAMKALGMKFRMCWMERDKNYRIWRIE